MKFLIKLPRLAKKLRIVIAWTLDLFSGRDITQIITLRDVEEISDQLARIRAHRKQAAPNKVLPLEFCANRDSRSTQMNANLITPRSAQD